MMRLAAIAALVCIAAGCAMHDGVWKKNGASKEALDADSADCATQTLSVPHTQGMLSHRTYVSCMHQRGWKRSPPEQASAAANPASPGPAR